MMRSLHGTYAWKPKAPWELQLESTPSTVANVD